MNIIETLSYELQNEGYTTTYIYRLLENNLNSIKGYGIEIEQQKYVDNQLVNIERNSIERISTNKDKTAELLSILHRNTVSPIHLVEILGEYVDQHINEFELVAN